MIDLHIHFPMRLLGGVEAPRDVIKGMTKARGREEDKLRAALLAAAARLFNFRDWDGTWRVTPQLLQQGDVSVACSVLYRPFSELDLAEPYAAPPESAYYGKLLELLEATEREVADTDRFGGQKYNVSDHTIVKIAARGGVIGLTFAQHQTNDGLRRTDTKTLAESVDVLARHIDAIGPRHVALGSDLDGFIKPTLGGIETAADLAPLAQALRARYPADADDILEGNARRVIERRFA